MKIGNERFYIPYNCTNSHRNSTINKAVSFGFGYNGFKTNNRCNFSLKEKIKKIFHLKLRNEIQLNKSEIINIENKSLKNLVLAQNLLEKIENGYTQKNINIYKISYKNNDYMSLGIANDEGCLSKIIQIKNNNVEAVYDIKTPNVNINDTEKKVKADCYFYEVEDEKIKREYYKNITNSVFNFHRVYDPETGGLHKVKVNDDKSPVELYLSLNNN